MMHRLLQKLTTTAGIQGTRPRRPWARTLALATLGVVTLSLGLLGGRPTPASALDASIPATLWGGVNYTGGARELYAGSIVSFEDTTWDDAASSIQILPGTKVAIYSDPHLTGVCQVLTVSTPNLGTTLIGDNRLSSLHVGADCWAPVLRLYADLNFTGANRVPEALVSGWEGKDLRRAGFNDTITSIKVPAGQKIAVFADINHEGRCEVFTADDPDLRNNWVGNDTISSYILNADCPLYLYEHPNFGGRRWAVSGNVADIRDSQYGYPYLNDAVSSIRVPRGKKIAVFEHINYGGRCEVFTADDGNLSDNRIGDNTISSFKVGGTCP